MGLQIEFNAHVCSRHDLSFEHSEIFLDFFHLRQRSTGFSYFPIIVFNFIFEFVRIYVSVVEWPILLRIAKNPTRCCSTKRQKRLSDLAQLNCTNPWKPNNKQSGHSYPRPHYYSVAKFKFLGGSLISSQFSLKQSQKEIKTI